MPTGWHHRFFQSTRGRVLALLRGAARTVNEISGTLGLTQNAVRVQLSALERDGLVKQRGTRAGTRKPHLSYELTDEAEALFPKAYSPVLTELLAVLTARLPEQTVNEILDEAGRRLAKHHFPEESADLDQRLGEVLSVLTQIGGYAELVREGDAYVIVGTSCPIYDTVKTHPTACRSLSSMLSKATGAEVVEKCQKGAKPRCRFELRLRSAS
jgi:predicted ArsR family transcriptional regulator